MLLLCIGPDTFRAQQKARELEVVFREKHDPSGSSVERIQSGKEAVEDIASRAQTRSLFSPRRFLRTSNLLTDASKNQLKSLVQALKSDVENIIVVSVEDEPPNEATAKALAEVPKVVRYDFPVLMGSAFVQQVQQMAQTLKVPDERAVLALARAVDGDAWFAYNELLKMACGGTSDVIAPPSKPTIFAYAEMFLTGDARGLAIYGDRDALEGSLSTFVTQTRAALRVQDRALDGLHPFIAKKLQGVRTVDAEAKFGRALQALLAQRAGYGDEKEAMLAL